jgi:membrane associated rhomboid family serine protease
MLFPFHDNNPTLRPPLVTIALIVVNAAAFVAVERMPPVEQQQFIYQRGFVPRRIEQLRDPALRIVVPLLSERPERPPWELPGQAPPQLFLPLMADPGAIYLSLLTAMFLHGSWMHLLGNMWFLWLFGNNIEDRLGHLPFLVFYLLGGLAATFCHWAVGPHSTVPVIGASGAIAAVLGGYSVTYPRARVRCLLVVIVFVTEIELPALAVLGVWFVMQLLEALGTLHLQIGGGVAWWAHVGGFVAGAGLMPLAARLIPPLGPPAAGSSHLHAS